MGRDPSAHSSIAVAPGSTPAERGRLDPVLARESSRTGGWRSSTRRGRPGRSRRARRCRGGRRHPPPTTRARPSAQIDVHIGTRAASTGMVVQPPLAVLLGQVRMGRVLGEQVVEPAGGGVDDRRARTASNTLAEATGQSHEARDVRARAVRADGGSMARTPDGRERLASPAGRPKASWTATAFTRSTAARTPARRNCQNGS